MVEQGWLGIEVPEADVGSVSVASRSLVMSEELGSVHAAPVAFCPDGARDRRVRAGRRR